jgi:glyoxylase-like metal-dependent hydrolase (beta-lactamase superfamily II)
MTTLATGISFVDLEFQGLPRVIASALLHGADGIAVIDPGPSSSLAPLRAHLAAHGASVQDITTLLITHIHLDHAGAAGTLLLENPRIKVLVHEVGAPHLVDPGRLLASAGRLYGDAMERLWGEVRPVPASAIVSLRGGETIAAGGRHWQVACTPGHASHHVAYYSGDAGLAFVGDTAGVQVVPGGVVLPPTPPPDIDLPQWMQSIDRIEQWHPQQLFLTHFGPVDSVASHLAELREQLRFTEQLALAALARTDDEREREQWFVDGVTHRLQQRLNATDLRAYEVAGRFDLNWRGMSRYLRRRERR